jgi:hypothetical protein
VRQLGHRRAAVRERDAADDVQGGVRRSGSVQGGQEPAQADRGALRVSGRVAGGNLSWQERDDAPRPRVAKARLPDPHWHRNGQRQPGRKNREPPLFVHQEPGGQRAPGQPGHQHIADPAHDVVPPAGDHLDRQTGKVKVLGGQQPPDQIRGDVHLSGRHALWTHAGDPSRLNSRICRRPSGPHSHGLHAPERPICAGTLLQSLDVRAVRDRAFCWSLSASACA